ncbi:MAG: hypothetical protein JWM11_175 [Planctomycetaceae bacterium]|nr:hypothetical protein [Planctomycetaceae bacterium]
MPLRDQSISRTLSEVVNSSQIAVKNDTIRLRNVGRRERLDRRAEVRTKRGRRIDSSGGRIDYSRKLSGVGSGELRFPPRDVLQVLGASLAGDFVQAGCTTKIIADLLP